MSRIATTSTLVPPMPDFPVFLPEPPRPHHTPLAPRGQGPGRLHGLRDLSHELDDLSDEENELEDIRNEIKNRGSSWLVPIGKQQTLQEEKIDASSDLSDGGSVSNGQASETGDNDNEPDSVVDLDAAMADLDDFDNDGEGFNAEELTHNDDADPSDTGNASVEEMQE